MRHFAACLFLFGCVSDPGTRPPIDGGAEANDMDGVAPGGDVTFKVNDGYGKPLSMAIVQVGTSQCTTDATGQCILKNVPATYDVLVAYASSLVQSGKRITAWQGLTTRTPTLEALAAISHHNDFAFTITNANQVQGDAFAIIYATTTASSAVDFVLPGPMGTVPNVFWYGEDPNKGKLFAWLMTIENQLPKTWKTTLKLPIDFTINGNTPVTQPIDFSNPGMVTPGAVSGTLDPNGTMANTLNFFVVAPTGTGRIQFTNNNIGASFTSSIPMNTTADIAYGGVTGGRGAWVWKTKIAPNTTNLKLTALGSAAFVNLSMPANNAMADSMTQYQWTGSNPTSLFRFFCPAGNGPYTYIYELLTTKSSAQIPNTSGLGASLSSGMGCAWQVINFSGAKTTDDLAQPAGWNHFTGPLVFTQDGSMSVDARSVTLK